MSITRSTYLRLSTALRAAHPGNSWSRADTPVGQHQADCEAVADVLGDGNQAFDRARFIRDCGARPRSKLWTADARPQRPDETHTPTKGE